MDGSSPRRRSNAVLSGILEWRDAAGAALAGVGRVTPLRSDTSAKPRRTNAITPAFVDEGATVPESNLTFGGVSIVPKKIAALVKVSRELAEDSAEDIGQYLSRELGWGLAGLQDDCVFNGDGGSSFGGVLGLGAALTGMASAIPAAAGHDTLGEIDIADLSSLVAGVRGDALPGARWFCSARAKPCIAQA